MKKWIVLLWLITLGMTSGILNSQKSPQAFNHPGMLQTRSDLELLKQKIAADEQR